MNVYAQPHYSGIAALQQAIADDDAETLGTLIIGAALYEEDYDTAYRACLALTRHRDEVVRGNAILGFGHLARIFGRTGDEAPAIVRAGLGDPSEYVRGQADSAAMDLESYLGITVIEVPDPQ